MTKKKKWLFLVLFLVNLAVILSFVFFTKKIRNDEKLRIDGVVNVP